MSTWRRPGPLNDAFRVAIPMAWVNFNGVTGGSIRASQNVTSVSRLGTGNYTVTMSTACIATEYHVFGMGGALTTSGSVGISESIQHTTTSFRIDTRSANDTLVDMDVMSVAALGRA